MFSIVVSVMLAFVGILSAACCGDNDPTRVDSFVVNGLTTSYVNTDTVNLEGLSIDVTYDNQQTEKLTNYEIDVDIDDVKEDTQFILETNGLSAQIPGDLDVRSYAITAYIVAFDQTLSLGTVTVSLAEATSIISADISGMPTSFVHTDTVDLENEDISLRVTYNNHESATLTEFEVDTEISDVQAGTQFVIYTDGLSQEPAGDLTEGSYNITVRVVGFDDNISLMTINVTHAPRTSVESVVLNNLKTSYYTVNDLNFEDLSLTVTYDNGDEETLTEYEIDPAEVSEGTQFVLATSGLSSQTNGELQEGNYDITAQVVGFDGTFKVGTVEVKVATPSDITTYSATNLPSSYLNTTTTNIAEDLLAQNIALQVTYGDGQDITLTNYEVDIDAEDAQEDTQFIILTNGLTTQTSGNLEIKSYRIDAQVVGVTGILENIGSIEVTLAPRTSITNVSAENLDLSYLNTDNKNLTDIALKVTFDNHEVVTLTNYELDVNVDEVQEETEFVISTSGFSTQTDGNLEIREYSLSAQVVGFEGSYNIGTIEVTLAPRTSISSFEVNGLTLAYENLDTVNLNGITLKVTYNNHESEILNSYVIDGTAQAGTEFILNTDGLSSEEAGNLTVKDYTITAQVVGYEGSLNLGTITVTRAEATSVEEVKINNLTTSYFETDTVNLQGITVDVTYDNHLTETLTVYEIDVEIESVKPGTKFVIYTDGLSSETAGDLTLDTYEITVKVVGYDETFSVGTVEVESDWNRYDLTFFDEPQFVTDYNTSISAQGTEDSFYSTSEKYTVGDDNAFVFKPEIILFLKDASDESSIYVPETYNTTVKVYLLADGSQTLLNDDTYYTYSDFEFDFTEAAIGHEFKIEVLPSDFDTMDNGGVVTPVTFEFKVEDGWNVYTADDLARINLLDEGFDPNASGNRYARAMSQNIFYNASENRYEARSYATIWENYLTEKGYTDLTAVNAIFLHGNLSITKEDLPEEYFVSQVEANKNTPGDSYSVGSLRDFAFLYMHYLNDDFVINGNYFTLDFSDIPFALSNTSHKSYLYTSGQSKYYPSHSTVFGFSGLLDNTSESVVTLKNLNAKGNTNNIMSVDSDQGITQQQVSEASGAIIFFKIHHGISQIENCIAKNFLIAWFAEQRVSDVQTDVGNMYINQVKTYDCFNSGIFAYASDNNIVTNSEFKRFGGPVLLLVSQIVDPKDLEEGAPALDTDREIRQSEFAIDDSSIMESYVVGDEGWFIVQGATPIASTIPVLDNNLLKNFGNSIYYDIPNSDGDGGTTAKFNLVSLSMDSGYLSSSEKIYSSLLIGEESESNVAFSTDNSFVNENLNNNNIVVMSSEGDRAAFNATNYSPVAVETTHFKGDYIMLAMPQGNTQMLAVFQLKDLTTST